MTAAPRDGARVFQSSSVTSRRFPALRTLTVDDVEVMVMPPSAGSKSPKKAATAEGGKPLMNPNVVKPSAVESLGGAQRSAKAASSVPRPIERPPFRPCNPRQARESISDVQHGYVGIHSPYDLAHRLEAMERAEANKHVVSAEVYYPTAWSQARKQIEINYFLNSPDAETIEAERRCVRPAPAPAKCRHPLTSRGTSPRAATFARRRSAT